MNEAPRHTTAGSRPGFAPADPHTDTLDLASVRHGVEAVLHAFLDEKLQTIPHPRARPLVEHLRALVDAGGKRIRPVLCVIGWHAAGRRDTPPHVLHLAAAVELFHAGAMIHDDIIDRSTTRRGHPSAHHALRTQFTASPGSAAGAWFGDSAALVLGDLALSWSDQLLHRGRLDTAHLRATHPLLDTLRTEALTGCYVELLATGHHNTDFELALEINRLKSGRYTVERPLQLGAVLGGADQEVLDTCSAYAVPLGEAFQLRDDILGVFGDTPAMGKPSLGDLREGKPTPLLAAALSRADPGARERLHRLVGDPHLDDDGAAAVREILITTGAREQMEQLIEAKRLEALAALAEPALPEAVATALRHMAEAVTHRTA
ncbi:polyprenyl synthetase family protein [Streptomyces sp. NPDC047002]|uniref:polyprenyl synthetase family protein n=1 Tax=Streptomyces sp. NPDC047002 TaxID=3155475 RepID=UPI0034539986